MEVSLYHRLAGMGAGAMVYTAQDPALKRLWSAAIAVMEDLIAPEAAIHFQGEFPDQALETALMLSPVMVFFHEDPLYMGDRLRDFPLPQGQLPVVLALANVISACLRERFAVETFGQWLSTGDLGELWEKLAPPRSTWRQFTEAMVQFDLELSQQHLLKIYGAIAYGRGQWQESLAFVQKCEPILQIWVAILVGGLRGDRRLPIPVLQQNNPVILHHEVRRFWSRWSGLPSGNQLPLEQIPLIASGQVLQDRPTLKLVSQRHFP